ncbi:cation transporter [Neiella marina]|uniref:Cation transporter n=1 Tax=Neiella marina TaxID=508461 RepID=A0A8J2XNI1_9GAMM|nr:Na+/H+ antiporter subunit E [Neiella marina]GGA73435.1 cation transporter [Neiella marina]
MQAKSSAQTAKALAIVAWLVLLVMVWLLLSGLFKPLLIGLGLFSCVITVYVVNRTGFFDQPSLLNAMPRMPKYMAYLFVDIVKSSIDVTRIVLNPKLPISPTEIEMDAAPQGHVGQAILGNSITLSPGTVTIDVHQGKLRVHCLTQAGADELLNSKINQRTAELTEK